MNPLRRMTVIGLAAVSLLAAGCPGQVVPTDPATESPIPAQVDAEPADVAVAADGPLPANLYLDAYEAAVVEITADNVRQQLDAIERDVVTELDALR